ncbi:MAG: PEGA domain-containing protein [Vicinamibacterales bacterium]
MSRPPLVFRPAAESLAAPVVEDVPSGAAPGRMVPTSLPLQDLELQRPTESRDSAASAAHALVGPVQEDEGLDAFSTEQEIRFKTQRPPARSNRRQALIPIAGLALVAVLAGVYLVVDQQPVASSPVPSTASVQTGQAQFDSRPTGADVLIDGAVRGQTPLKLALPVGTYALEIRSEAGTRTLPLTIEAGVLVAQYVELLAAPALSQAGRLEIASDPAGAQVAVDGVARGVTPLTIEKVDAREHAITLTRGGVVVQRTVSVKAGASTSVMVAMSTPRPGAVGGYLSFSLPFEAQVFEGERLIGTSSSDQLMIPTGKHELELVNTALEFRWPVSVQVEPGRLVTPAVPIPDGTVSINALPWAEVFIDGRGVGTTPLANLAVPIGEHEVVWRHPQLGERRQRITVTAQRPARVGVNLEP